MSTIQLNPNVPHPFPGADFHAHPYRDVVEIIVNNFVHTPELLYNRIKAELGWALLDFVGKRHPGAAAYIAKIAHIVQVASAANAPWLWNYYKK